MSAHYENPLKKRLGSAFFKSLPGSPGIYAFFGANGEILYIGKAKSLRSRLRSYAQARPGSVPDHTLEMIESARGIQWRICRSEQAAFLKENELLHAIRPPYNILGTEPEHYLFLGVRNSESVPRHQPRDQYCRLDFRLSSRTESFQLGGGGPFRIYGCYQHRRLMKTGYTALLRLLHASLLQKDRFAYPAAITRESPPWNYSTDFPLRWLPELDAFLQGKRLTLLRLIFQALLENERVPRFMRPSLQADLATVRLFFRLGPQTTLKLLRKHGHRRFQKDRQPPSTSHDEMDEFVRLEYAF